MTLFQQKYSQAVFKRLLSVGLLFLAALTVLTIEAKPKENLPTGPVVQFRSAYLEAGKTAPLGKIAWQVKTMGKLQGAPALDVNNVYVASSTGQVYAFSREKGILQWQSTLSSPPLAEEQSEPDAVQIPPTIVDHSSPALFQNLLIIGTSTGQVVALNKTNGDQVWQLDTGMPIVSSPQIVNGVAYIASRSGKVYALDALTGQSKWEYDTGSVVDASLFLVADKTGDKVYFADYRGRCYALNAQTGKVLWTYTVDGPVTVSPVVLGNTAYFSTQVGALYALDSKTGNKQWSYITAWGKPIYVPVIVQGDKGFNRIYVGDGEGNIICLNGQYGTQIWAKALAGPIMSAPVLVNQVLYAATGLGNLYALSAKDGTELWKTQVNSMIESGLVVNGGDLYFGANNGRLYALK